MHSFLFCFLIRKCCRPVGLGRLQEDDGVLLHPWKICLNQLTETSLCHLPHLANGSRLSLLTACPRKMYDVWHETSSPPTFTVGCFQQTICRHFQMPALFTQADTLSSALSYWPLCCFIFYINLPLKCRLYPGCN